MTIRYRLLHPDAKAPEYKTAGASGMDLCAVEKEGLYRGETRRIRTGVAVEIPSGFEGQVRPRSSVSAEGLLCHFGTIDADYRGEIWVVVASLPSAPTFVSFEPGDRIAQLVIAPVERVELVEAEQLSETARGSGAFGSTGR